MNSDDSQKSEQVLFDELPGRYQFDDSVHEKHQRDLRLQFLQAFDSSQFDSKVVVASVAKTRNAAQVIGVVAALTACILGVVSLLLMRDRHSFSHLVTEIPPDSNEPVDHSFIASLAEVDALREERPAELFFDALSICQHEHEARKLDSEAKQMRLFYESFLLSLPVTSPKG